MPLMRLGGAAQQDEMLAARDAVVAVRVVQAHAEEADELRAVLPLFGFSLHEVASCQKSVKKTCPINDTNRSCAGSIRNVRLFDADGRTISIEVYARLLVQDRKAPTIEGTRPAGADVYNCVRNT